MSASGSDNLKELADVVARNGGNVLSLPSAGLVRNFKSRFLGETPEGIWVEAASEALLHLRELVETEHPIAISFKGGKILTSFKTKVLRIETQYKINADTTVVGVLIERPTELKGMQRRANYRVHISAESSLSARIWSIPEHAYLKDRPMAAQEIKIELRDLSIGGMGIRLMPVDAKSHKPVADQRLRVQLRFEESELILEGRLRIPTLKSASDPATPKIAGVVFKRLESDVEGRQNLAILTRIVGELQREEVRRLRLGLAS